MITRRHTIGNTTLFVIDGADPTENIIARAGSNSSFRIRVTPLLHAPENSGKKLALTIPRGEGIDLAEIPQGFIDIVVNHPNTVSLVMNDDPDGKACVAVEFI